MLTKVLGNCPILPKNRMMVVVAVVAAMVMMNVLF